MNPNNDATNNRRTVLPMWLRAASVLGIVIGVAGTAIGFGHTPLDAWIWLLVGYVFFAGIANGALAWAAAFRVAQARWTPAINRLGHSLIAFLPVLILALIAVLSQAARYMPWARNPIPAKAAWLNVPFMVTRDLVFVGVLYLLFYLLVRWSLSADSESGRLGGITEKDRFRLNGVATAAIMMYTITGSIIAWDLIMSLSPIWVSTMFAPYIWITNMYAGMALLIMLSALLRKRLHIEQYLEAQQFQDMGNLMLGFALFSMGLFFAQYLTIWYENLPDETPFLILRYDKSPWPYLGWTSFILAYAIPFVILQSRHIKRRPEWMLPISVVAIAGVALERYVLIVPSLAPTRLLINPLPALVFLAFAGTLILSVAAFLERYSPVSSADEALREAGTGLEAVT